VSPVTTRASLCAVARSLYGDSFGPLACEYAYRLVAHLAVIEPGHADSSVVVECDRSPTQRRGNAPLSLWGSCLTEVRDVWLQDCNQFLEFRFPRRVVVD
jgi:hypothetical protein